MQNLTNLCCRWETGLEDGRLKVQNALKHLGNNLKFFGLLRMRNDKVFPNIHLKLFIFPSQPFRKQRARSGPVLHMKPFISKVKQRSRSHPSTHSTVLIKYTWLPIVRIKSTVTMTPHECKPRHPQGARYSSIIIAFTSGIKKPKVMSPQSHPRNISINYWMTNDQLPNEGIFFTYALHGRT
jgi:hypothetical protein